MVERNRNFDRLSRNYLFKKMAEIAANYEDVIDLSIGDTSHPIPENITRAMSQKAKALSTPEGYTGYPSPGGELCELLAKRYGVSPDEVFLSDGAKSDIGRIQLLFGPNVSIAVQDPTYPVYVDTSLLVGQQKVIRLPCTAENGFFPKLEKADLIYFCSPNNPTGHIATHKQLSELVKFAKANGSIIIFDSAYAAFSDGPQSIYEIEGAREVAIEVSSFSKTFGFTGVRLGWSIVPKELSYADGRPVHSDYLRIATTFFNGPCNVAEAGGVEAMKTDPAPIIDYYQENARLLAEALSVEPTKAPYLFVKFGKDSWKEFEKLLERTGVLSIPGSGFGPSGEGYLRFSALSARATVEEAANRLQSYFGAAC